MSAIVCNPCKLAGVSCLTKAKHIYNYILNKLDLKIPSALTFFKTLCFNFVGMVSRYKQMFSLGDTSQKVDNI